MNERRVGRDFFFFFFTLLFFYLRDDRDENRNLLFLRIWRRKRRLSVRSSYSVLSCYFACLLLRIKLGFSIEQGNANTCIVGARSGKWEIGWDREGKRRKEEGWIR